MKFIFNHKAQTFGDAVGMTEEDDIQLEDKIKEAVAQEMDNKYGLSEVLENMINNCSQEELALIALEFIKHTAKSQMVMNMLRGKSKGEFKSPGDVARDNKKSHE